MTADGRLRSIAGPVIGSVRLVGVACGHAAWWLGYQINPAGRDASPAPPRRSEQIGASDRAQRR